MIEYYKRRNTIQLKHFSERLVCIKTTFNFLQKLNNQNKFPIHQKYYTLKELDNKPKHIQNFSDFCQTINPKHPFYILKSNQIKKTHLKN